MRAVAKDLDAGKEAALKEGLDRAHPASWRRSREIADDLRRGRPGRRGFGGADWTGIPVGRMVKDEIETVLKLADR